MLPFFHAYGLTVSLLTAGPRAHAAPAPALRARAVLDLLETQRPELVPAVPAMLHALNKLMRGRPHDLSFIRWLLSGASALEPDVRREFESYGVRNLVEGYGLTEASPVTHANPPGEGNRPGTIGLPLPDTEARLADPDTGAKSAEGGRRAGGARAAGDEGLLQQPAGDAGRAPDGWLFTGDMARRDADGYYTIVDRKRDIIKTSGFLVFPAEVEEVLGLSRRGRGGGGRRAGRGARRSRQGADGAAQRRASWTRPRWRATAGCTWASTSGRGRSRWSANCRRISWARCCAASCARPPAPAAAATCACRDLSKSSVCMGRIGRIGHP